MQQKTAMSKQMGWVTDFRVLGLSIALAAVGASTTVQTKSKPVPKQPSFVRDVAPITTKFCAGCHKGKEAPAGIDVGRFKSEAAAKADLATWERISRAISTGAMPPKGMPSPTKAQRERIAEWVETTIAADCRLADPGRVTIRRLNREEYNNTIRDLIGVDLRPADDFPSDDVGHGFDNIGDVLSISPILMEKYLDAAEKVAKKAIMLPKSDTFFFQPEETSNTVRGAYGGLTTAGEIGFDHEFAPGMYRIKVRAFGDQAGPENARMQLVVGSQPVQDFEVVAKQAKPEVYEAPVRVTRGKNRVGVRFLNDYYQPQNPPGNRDRNLWVDYIEVVGPIGGAAALPESHLRIIPAKPPQGKERVHAQKLLRDFASRAYRRPASPEEVERLMQIFDLAMKYKEPFERGIQLGVQAVLVSPNFIFRAEIDPKLNPGSSRSLNGYELATRLSYFLWSSTPDNRLLMLAGDGSLGKPEVLKQEVRRMLADKKARALADNFAEQWLTLRKLEIIQPDPKQFPQYTKEVKDAYVQETKLFFNAVVQYDRSVLDFIDGKFTYVNELLAKQYGIPNVRGPEFRKVALAGSERGGVLTHGSVLTVTSNPTRTSPTKRGRWVLEQILGTPPPPPPPGADVLAESAAMTGKTLREKMIQHRKDPACASCHAKMDPLGFGLENFDAIGAWRIKDGEVQVDSSGELPDGTRFSGPSQLRALLMKDKEQFVKSLSEKLLTYALGRGVDFADRCHIDTIAAQTAKSNYKFSALVNAIVTSEPFRKRRTN